MVWLSKLCLYPYTVHCLVVFSVFHHTVMVFALNALETWLGTLCSDKVAENVFDLFLEKVVGACFVISNVEVFRKLGHFFRCKSELRQIISTIVSEV